MSEWFSDVARYISDQCGKAWVFIGAIAIIIIWLITGPLFNFSDTWQLLINTGTTVVTFLMVFVIQNSQNRDTRATQLKLDELIRATENARNYMRGIEDLSEDDLRRIKQALDGIAGEAT
jgi:low affinity Fe/Cu permease